MHAKNSGIKMSSISLPMAAIEPPEAGEPEGCIQCQAGSKLVLFVTGRCHWKCDYCPLSDNRRESSVMYANERACEHFEEVIEEARQMNATGTGITGGDPMMDIERSLEAIRHLKRAFGPQHHIHLYTSIPVKEKIIQEFSDAGLDEIRFHILDLNLSPYHSSIIAANKAGIKVGIELPSMPDQRDNLFILIEELRNVPISFLNLNELELTVGNDQQMAIRGFNLGRSSPAGAEGSIELAYDIKARIEAAEFGFCDPFDGTKKQPYGFHLKACTASYKDAGQLRSRFRRRAHHTLRPYESLTEDDTIIFGAIFCSDEKELLQDANDFLMTTDLSEVVMKINHDAMRLEIPAVLAEDFASELLRPVALIEVHPTFERLEVGLIWLNDLRPPTSHPSA